MSRRIEWMGAAAVLRQIEIIMPGEEWAGAGYQDKPVLVIAGDEITAVEGRLEDLEQLGYRIGALATELIDKRSGPEVQEQEQRND